MERKIIEEIATTIALLGGQSDILSIVSSINDCQSDENILSMLKGYNENKKKQLEDTLKYYNR